MVQTNKMSLNDSGIQMERCMEIFEEKKKTLRPMVWPSESHINRILHWHE